MSFIDIDVAEGQTMQALWVPAETAEPKKAPAIVLVQEIFGINDALQLKAKQWASQGYNVLCPDLFWRFEPGVTLDPTIPEEFEKGVDFMQKMQTADTLADLEATRAKLAELIGHDRIAAVGYCMGGRLVVEMAGEVNIKCAVSFYGVSLESVLPALPADAAVSFLHIAELDSYVPEDVRQIIIKEVERRDGWGYELYENCDHAFARPNGAHFVADAAAKAEQLSIAFMQKHLAS
ncbi:Carboxymethylenebutenolidase [Oligella ureolytica]|uniref:Carboxymethylenebutenolidase n=1 Tax=Oligella ureolytica TaxID=90244 RepID=A0A378XIR0_9BURK|nr:dienelactone hydrolase family protein [Oligella ureolytica]QPT39733.1 dienelactone hydrolase family protein [Oligella ureolytica]SUA57364.1 Carboxymethylenebutenolidase [Oligella ureolytica]